MESKTPIIEKIKQKAGSHKMEKVLYHIIEMERMEKRSDEKEYSKKIGEMNIRVKKRHDIIMELEQLGITRAMFKEELEMLMSEQEKDTKEIDSLNDRRRDSSKRSKEFARIMAKLTKMF